MTADRPELVSTTAPSTLIEPSRRIITTLAEYLAAFDFLIGVVRRELRIVDADTRQLSLNAPARVELLRTFLRRNLQNRLLIAVHAPELLREATPRFLTLMAEHSEQIAVRQTQEEGSRAQDCFALADADHLVRRGAQSNPRGVVITSSNEDCGPIRLRFEEIWESAVPCIAITTLGL
jgi:hypothetical protein